MKRFTLLLLFVSIISISAYSQSFNYRGIVLDSSNNEPIIGANVVVQGTTFGTITGFDGCFELTAPAPCIFEISAIGYYTLVTQASYTSAPYYLDPYSRKSSHLFIFKKKSKATAKKIDIFCPTYDSYPTHNL